MTSRHSVISMLPNWHRAIAAFAALAVGATTTAARQAPRPLWLVPGVLWTVVFVLAAARFRAPVEPFLILLASLALVGAWDRLSSARTQEAR